MCGNKTKNGLQYSLTTGYLPHFTYHPGLLLSLSIRKKLQYNDYSQTSAKIFFSFLALCHTSREWQTLGYFVSVVFQACIKMLDDKHYQPKVLATEDDESVTYSTTSTPFATRKSKQ